MMVAAHNGDLTAAARLGLAVHVEGQPRRPIGERAPRGSSAGAAAPRHSERRKRSEGSPTADRRDSRSRDGDRPARFAGDAPERRPRSDARGTNESKRPTRGADARWRIARTGYARSCEVMMSLDDAPSLRFTANRWAAGQGAAQEAPPGA